LIACDRDRDTGLGARDRLQQRIATVRDDDAGAAKKLSELRHRHSRRRAQVLAGPRGAGAFRPADWL